MSRATCIPPIVFLHHTHMPLLLGPHSVHHTFLLVPLLFCHHYAPPPYTPVHMGHILLYASARFIPALIFHYCLTCLPSVLPATHTLPLHCIHFPFMAPCPSPRYLTSPVPSFTALVPLPPPYSHPCCHSFLQSPLPVLPVYVPSRHMLAAAVRRRPFPLFAHNPFCAYRRISCTARFNFCTPLRRACTCGRFCRLRQHLCTLTRLGLRHRLFFAHALTGPLCNVVTPPGLTMPFRCYLLLRTRSLLTHTIMLDHHPSPSAFAHTPDDHHYSPLPATVASPYRSTYAYHAAASLPCLCATANMHVHYARTWVAETPRAAVYAPPPLLPAASVCALSPCPCHTTSCAT